MNNETAAQQGNTADALKKKKKLVIPKLTAADLAAFPGANLPTVKVAEPDFTYSIVYQVPVTDAFGTSGEAGQVHDFAHQLDAQAKAKNVGNVVSISAEDSVFDIGLKLNETGKQANNSAPAANAFVQLKDFLNGAALLKQGPAGKPVTYKLKVNGTTIGGGSY
jgi:hypothetical protein